MVSVGFWFEKNRGVATGIAVTGNGLGMFVLPTICTLLIENYGWVISMYALSGIFFFGALLSLLYRESPAEIYHSTPHVSSNGHFYVISQVPLWEYFLASL